MNPYDDMLMQQTLQPFKDSMAALSAKFANPQVSTQPVAGGGPTGPGGNIKLGGSLGGYSGTTGLNAQVQYDGQNRPMRNPYSSIADQNGNLLDRYSIGNKIGPDVQLDNTALNTIQNRALSTTPSPWADLANQRLQLDQNNMIDQAQRNTAAGVNGAYNQLAMRGGLSSGQRERLAMQGQRQGMQATQGIYNQGLLGRNNIAMQDQMQKDNFLTQLPGMQQNAANFAQAQRAYKNNAQSTDIANALKDVYGYNAYNSDAYKEAMSAWGADKTAQGQEAAARAAAPSGGLLGGSIIPGFL